MSDSTSIQTEPNSTIKIESRQRSPSSRPAELHREHEKNHSDNPFTNDNQRLEESNAIVQHRYLHRNHPQSIGNFSKSRPRVFKLREQLHCQELKTHSQSGQRS
jgi:hypothetical protein